MCCPTLNRVNKGERGQKKIEQRIKELREMDETAKKRWCTVKSTVAL